MLLLGWQGTDISLASSSNDSVMSSDSASRYFCEEIGEVPMRLF